MLPSESLLRGDVDSANFLAQISLFLWIPVTAVLFIAFRPPLATVLSLVLAWMFLPEKVVYDAPALPPFDKNGFAVGSAFVAALVFCPKRIRRARPDSRIEWLYLVGAIGCVGTAMTNGDPLFHGPLRIPALGWYDAASMIIHWALDVMLPFFLGKAFIREERDLRDLLMVLAAGAIFYSPFILLEARMSPQLNVWIYGFHQSAFIQTLRAGGYRPMVFMSHGLAVAFFVLIGLIAAATLAKIKGRIVVIRATYAVPYLSAILIVCKTLGSFVYAVTMLPIVWWLSPRNQVRTAALLGIFVLIYPVLKATGTFPDASLVALSTAVSPERAESLAYRFQNETELVEKGKERPWFGWGGFSRGRVIDKEGTVVSVTDGLWIIEFTNYGVFGLVAGFGLLVGPLFIAVRRFSLIKDRSARTMLAGLCVMVVINAIDSLPNAPYTSFQYFLPGALLGFLQGFAGAATSHKVKSPQKITTELATVEPRYVPT